MADVLIVADDLSGAADAAAAAGGEALVVLDSSGIAESRIVALDIDSRRLTPEAARHRACSAIRGAGPSPLIYQKMDSILRGNWVSEMIGIREALPSSQARKGPVILAPAWPERGRTTRSGHVYLNGLPIEDHALTDDNGRLLRGSICDRLAERGLSTTIVRAGSQARIVEQLEAAVSAAVDVVICDASTRSDLDDVAAASFRFGECAFGSGSGGLLASLTAAGGAQEARAVRLPLVFRPCLIVVGSASEISHRQLNALSARGVQHLVIGQGHFDLVDGSLLRGVERAFASNRDVAISIDRGPGGRLQSEIVSALAEAVMPALPSTGGLILTGGETARAVLSRAGVHAIHVLGEIEPGVPHGVTAGEIAVPVVTKSGAFGDDATLSNALLFLHAGRVVPSSPYPGTP